MVQQSHTMAVQTMARLVDVLHSLLRFSWSIVAVLLQHLDPKITIH